ncbi:thiol-disulfide oxidoreductase DCC family protein [Brevibacillus borstelensis]|uniref:thiol-disulfide oxidoreductase DCC family protein n=1 Tax=Brevibacillus borstelensis TaxID=45462 RepID=UPI0030BD808E
MSNASPSDTILLFDGVCNFCNSAVRFIIPRDPAGRIRFASLQSATGQRLLQEHGLSAHDLSSVVLIDQGTAFVCSDAVLRVGRLLNGAWPIFSVLGYLFPRFFRDGLYRFLARNRYRWFGRSAACLLPTAEIRARFLD